VLCIDKLPDLTTDLQQLYFYTTGDLTQITSAADICSKYAGSADKLRWSLKPVFLNYLLQTKAEKVIYIDNDIFFYKDCTFLFDMLDEYDFLLTPHYYPHDPKQNQNWLEANFKVGLYNAGFVAVSKAAGESLDWWAKCCAYRCEKNMLRGTFDDQKYLDLIPVINEKAQIIRHKGCNVAEWNRSVITRTESENEVLLDGIYPLIFIHFNNTTIRAIIENNEPVLKKSFDIYFEALKKHKPELKVTQLYGQDSWLSKLKYLIWKTATSYGL